jgi:hypothetical protein
MEAVSKRKDPAGKADRAKRTMNQVIAVAKRSSSPLVPGLIGAEK